MKKTSQKCKSALSVYSFIFNQNVFLLTTIRQNWMSLIVRQNVVAIVKKKKNKALNKWMEILPLLLKINFEQGKNKDKTKY